MKVFKLYVYFWITSLVIFTLGLFTFSDERALIDINVHDIYYVTHIFNLLAIIALFYFMLGISYWSLHKYNVKIIKPLAKIHTIATIGGFIFYLLFMTIFEDDTQLEGSHFANESSTLYILIKSIFFIIVISQVLFFINLIISTIKHGIQRTTSKQN